MTPREPVRLAEVEAAAEGDYLGEPWAVDRTDPEQASVIVDDGLWPPTDVVAGVEVNLARYIATVDPPTVKAMVEALRQAEAALSHVARQGRLRPAHPGKNAVDLAEYASDALLNLHRRVHFAAALRQPTYTEPQP